MFKNGNQAFYLSAKWKHKRARVMRLYHYEDAELARYGKHVEATMVHHIYPLEDYPELAMQTWNLIPLTTATHNRMHDRTTNKVTALGKQWQDRRRLKFEEWKSENERNSDCGSQLQK